MIFETLAKATSTRPHTDDGRASGRSPESLAHLASRRAQADELRASMTPGWRERGRSSVEGAIVGHASPAWRHPKGEDAAALNQRLSDVRAAAVRATLAEMLRASLGARASIALDASGVEPGTDAAGPLAPDDVAVGGVGAEVDARAGADADEPESRRVDIRLMVTHDFDGEAGLEDALAETYTVPGFCVPHASQRWAVKLSVSGSGGHAGVGGAFAIGQLRNLTTGEVESGAFVGGGIGLGLQSPGADPGWSDWVDFETAEPVTFADFQHTRARLTSAGAGVAVAGYAWTWLSFPKLGVQSIPLHGPNLGALGGDASTNIGVWMLDSVPPGEHCVPPSERTAEAMMTTPVPYTHASTDVHALSVYFDTGSARLGDDAMAQLRALAAEIGASWQAER